MHKAILSLPIYFLCIFLNVASASDNPNNSMEDEIGNQVKFVVDGIISYSRWPGMKIATKACIIGPTRFSKKILEPINTDLPYSWHPYNNIKDLGVNTCNVIYIGNLSSDHREEIEKEFVGTPVLTISEKNIYCDGAILVCLKIETEKVSFQVNLDAVARSGIRIHPQVLKLGR